VRALPLCIVPLSARSDGCPHSHTGKQGKSKQHANTPQLTLHSRAECWTCGLTVVDTAVPANAALSAGILMLMGAAKLASNIDVVRHGIGSQCAALICFTGPVSWGSTAIYTATFMNMEQEGDLLPCNPAVHPLDAEH
jgi:uncharacterized paraquat-inducible protein A